MWKYCGIADTLSTYRFEKSDSQPRRPYTLRIHSPTQSCAGYTLIYTCTDDDKSTGYDRIKNIRPKCSSNLFSPVRQTATDLHRSGLLSRLRLPLSFSREKLRSVLGVDESPRRADLVFTTGLLHQVLGNHVLVAVWMTGGRNSCGSDLSNQRSETVSAYT